MKRQRLEMAEMWVACPPSGSRRENRFDFTGLSLLNYLMIFTNRYLATSASLAAGQSHGQALSGHLGQRPDAAYLSSRVWSWPRVIAVGVLLLACLGSARAAISTWDNDGGDDAWNTAANWAPDGIPPATNDVVIDLSGASVSLTNSVTNLSLTLGGASAGTRTLIFSNWDTSLTIVSNVTIMTNGVITLPVAFTNEAEANRVYINCSNLTVAAGGSINVNYLGYLGIIDTNGFGPGRGCSAGQYGAGAGYGGYGGDGQNVLFGGFPYGSTNAPEHPGSSGGGTTEGTTYKGGNGGGALRINATGQVTVNGTITANGANGSVYCGGGSGGSVYITCNTFAGTNGIVSANGGNGGSVQGGEGGGGRIAIEYDPPAQGLVPRPDVQFLAKPGSSVTATREGDIGTLYFSDASLMPEAITNMSGQVWGVTNWSADTVMISNCWLRFPDQGFRLTVTNDLRVIGSNSKFQLGGGTILTNANGWILFFSETDTGLSLNVGGNLVLTNGADLYVYSAMTNSGTTEYGALVSVAGDVFIGSNSWVVPVSHPTNGGSVLFRMRNLTIAATNSGFNADEKGYRGGWAPPHYTNGYGPGGGGYAGGVGGGGGYGGQGGGAGAGFGETYGSSNAPVYPGSGGGERATGGTYIGGHGGGLVRIHATGTLTVNGIITANGRKGQDQYAGGGSGGGIYITCRTFCGATNGIFRANGGAGGVYNPKYGGGGGRIAVFRVCDESSGVISNYVDGGYGATANGDPGTIVWGWLPPARTIIRLY